MKIPLRYARGTHRLPRGTKEKPSTNIIETYLIFKKDTTKMINRVNNKQNLTPQKQVVTTKGDHVPKLLK